MKKLFEKIVQGLLTCSGFVTSIVILLIIGFLFTEGAGLFRGHVIEEGYVLALNRENPVSRLTAAQIKGVFDEDIVNWKEVGGPDLAIETFRLEDVDRYFSGEELGPRPSRDWWRSVRAWWLSCLGYWFPKEPTCILSRTGPSLRPRYSPGRSGSRPRPRLRCSACCPCWPVRCG